MFQTYVPIQTWKTRMMIVRYILRLSRLNLFQNGGGFHQSATVPRDLYETLTPPERYDIDKDCAHIFEMPKYKLKIEANPYVWVNDPERGRILKLKEFEVKREQPKKMLAPLF